MNFLDLQKNIKYSLKIFLFCSYFLFSLAFKAISQKDTAFERMKFRNDLFIDTLIKIMKVRNHETIEIIDSISSELKKKGVSEIISFVGLSYWSDRGNILWKENKVTKGIEFIYQFKVKRRRITQKFMSKERELIIKKLKEKVVNNGSLDSLFSYPCDIINSINQFENGIVSHPLIIYFLMDIAGKRENIYFSSFSWSVNKEFPCLTGLDKLRGGL